MVLVSRLMGRMAGMRPYLASTPAAIHDPVPGRLRVVVAGGGIAGASAAVVLAERGIPVVVCEAAGRPAQPAGAR
jgi:carotenoid phi-ring synthase / carotenoid chi-ring synthase